VGTDKARGAINMRKYDLFEQQFKTNYDEHPHFERVELVIEETQALALINQWTSSGKCV
jgi:hypothetical protein